MCAILDILSSVDFWKFAAPLIGAVVAWFANEWRKRLAEKYQRKEANYRQLLRSLRGFYIGAANAAVLKAEFLEELTAAWLYCLDHVILKAYAFLDTVHVQQVHSDEQKEHALGAFVAAIRADLLSRKLVRRTALTANDFRHLYAK